MEQGCCRTRLCDLQSKLNQAQMIWSSFTGKLFVPLSSFGKSKWKLAVTPLDNPPWHLLCYESLGNESVKFFASGYIFICCRWLFLKTGNMTDFIHSPENTKNHSNIMSNSIYNRTPANVTYCKSNVEYCNSMIQWKHSKRSKEGRRRGPGDGTNNLLWLVYSLCAVLSEGILV